MMLVGNKVDMTDNRVVSEDEAQQQAQTYGDIPFVEVSVGWSLLFL